MLGPIRNLLSGAAAFDAEAASYCLDKNVTYENRVNNIPGWNWCLVPDGGYDAVFFAGMAIVVMAVASPRWDALIALFAGGLYEALSYFINLGHVSNASALWLGMRPADIFVFVFLPPFLLDLAVRIDFFMLKKLLPHILMMAFTMVITTCLVLIPFMLYALDLKSSGWDAGYVALFGSAIASTDAAAVCAALSAGGAPEVLSVLLEGESLFNDASSLTLFEIFKEVVLLQEHKPLGQEIGDIVAKTLETALIGVAVGLAFGIFNKYLFVWLQHRNMPAFIEVAFTVGGAYLSFFITQVWCKGSGCVGVVAYGLYGNATLLWGMSNKTRQSGIFQYFWSVFIFIVNALIFFYVGASCVNFTIRASDQLYDQGGAAAIVSVSLYKLPIIYIYMLAVRATFLLVVFHIMRLLRIGAALTWQQCIFLAVGGIRGSLSLVLAQTIATLATTTDTGDRVKAEAAMYTAGFVIMTLIINAPLSAPLMTLLKLNKIGKEELLMRGHVKDTFFRFTATCVEELQADAEDDEMLQGVDWAAVETATDFKTVLDAELPEEQPRWGWRELCCVPTWLSLRDWCCSTMTCKSKAAQRRLELSAPSVAGAGSDDLQLSDDSEDERTYVRAEDARIKDDLSRMTAWKLKAQQSRGSDALATASAVPPAAALSPQGSDVLVIGDIGSFVGGGGAPTHTNSMPSTQFTSTRPSLTKARSMMRSGSLKSSLGPGGALHDNHASSNAYRVFSMISEGLYHRKPDGHATTTLDAKALAVSSVTKLTTPAVKPLQPQISGGVGGGAMGGAAGVNPATVSGSVGATTRAPARGSTAAGALARMAASAADLSTRSRAPGSRDNSQHGVQRGGVPVISAVGSDRSAHGRSRSAIAMTSMANNGNPLAGSTPDLAGLDVTSGSVGTTSVTTTSVAADSIPLRATSAGQVVVTVQPEGLLRATPGPSPAAAAAAAAAGPPALHTQRSNSVSSPRATSRFGPSCSEVLAASALPSTGDLPSGDSAPDSNASSAAATAGAASAGDGVVATLAAVTPPPTGSEVTAAPAAGAATAALASVPETIPASRTASTAVREKSWAEEFAARSFTRMLVIKANPGNVSGKSTASHGPPTAAAVTSPPVTSPEGGHDRGLRHSRTAGSQQDSQRPAAVRGETSLETKSMALRMGRNGPNASLGHGSLSMSGNQASGGDSDRPHLGARSAGGALGTGTPGGEPSLATSSRGLARGSRNPHFYGEVGAAAGEMSMFAPVGAHSGDEPPPQPFPGGSRKLGRGSVSGQVGARGLAKSSVGSRFFTQETERALTRSSFRTAVPVPEVFHPEGQDGIVMAGGPGGPMIMRDSVDIKRSSRTGAPLGRLSNMSASRVWGSSIAAKDSVGAPGSIDEARTQMLSEYRLRLLAGLKSYFKCRYIDGILSPQSYKTLSYVSSKAHEEPERPLPLWDLAKLEVSSGALLQWEAHAYYWLKLKLNKLKGSSNWLSRHVLAGIVAAPAMLFSAHLSHVQLAGLEATVELWISLTTSLQTQWLQYSGQYGALVLSEVNANADGAWQFIVDRRIEDPEKFQAIQTYRATVQVLSQQLAFVEEMSHGGMIDEKEAARMEDAMQRRLQQVVRKGPQWRRQSVKEILSGVPFLRNIHPRVVHWLRTHSTIKVYGQGECIWERWSDSAPAPGMFIVISGVVRLMMQLQSGNLQPVFLGSGGVGGLIMMVLGSGVSGVGMRAAYAEGNALGKGPVVMHIPREIFTAIQHFSRVERVPTWQQLELNIFRTAAAYVLDMLRPEVMHQLGVFVSSGLASCVLSDRLDSKVAKRQRIRALLKEAMDHSEGLEGAPGTLAHLDWVGELLALPPAAALALLDGSLDATLATAPWHKAMFQAIAAATGAVYDLIKASVRESWLIALQPGQTVWQSSTMVLIQGSLKALDDATSSAGSMTGPPHASPTPAVAPAAPPHPHGALHGLPPALDPVAEGPSFLTDSKPDMGQGVVGPLASTVALASPRSGSLASRSMPTYGAYGAPHSPRGQAGVQEPQATFTATPNEEHVAPSMMVWIADFFDVEVPTQEPLPIIAGPEGATLLVWGVDIPTLLSGPEGSEPGPDAAQVVGASESPEP